MVCTRAYTPLLRPLLSAYWQQRLATVCRKRQAAAQAEAWRAWQAAVQQRAEQQATARAACDKTQKARLRSALGFWQRWASDRKVHSDGACSSCVSEPLPTWPVLRHQLARVSIRVLWLSTAGRSSPDVQALRAELTSMGTRTQRSQLSQALTAWRDASAAAALLRVRAPHEHDPGLCNKN